MRVEILVPQGKTQRIRSILRVPEQGVSYPSQDRKIFWLVRPETLWSRPGDLRRREKRPSNFVHAAGSCEICIEDGEEFTYGDVLGYIETGE